MNVGYALSSEEHAPLDLVRHAQAAERSGFEYVHQVGLNQEGFFKFYEREILPEARDFVPRTPQAPTA